MNSLHRSKIYGEANKQLIVSTLAFQEVISYLLAQFSWKNEFIELMSLSEMHLLKMYECIWMRYY